MLFKNVKWVKSIIISDKEVEAWQTGYVYKKIPNNIKDVKDINLDEVQKYQL